MDDPAGVMEVLNTFNKSTRRGDGNKEQLNISGKEFGIPGRAMRQSSSDDSVDPTHRELQRPATSPLFDGGSILNSPKVGI